MHTTLSPEPSIPDVSAPKRVERGSGSHNVPLSGWYELPRPPNSGLAASRRVGVRQLAKVPPYCIFLPRRESSARETNLGGLLMKHTSLPPVLSFLPTRGHHTRRLAAALVLGLYLGLAGQSAAQGFTERYRFNGSATEDRFGASVTSRGDVNGDGTRDIIVGAPGGLLALGPRGSIQELMGP